MNLDVLSEILSSPIGAHGKLKDTIIRDEPGWYQIINPSVKEAGKNEIILCEKESEDPETLFEKHYNEYKNYDVPFKWCWNPKSRPHGLKEVLNQNCSKQWRYSGMYCNPKELSVSYSKEITVKEVDQDTAEDYVICFSKGWDLDGIEKRRAHINNQISSPNRIEFYYLAYYQGQPIGTAGFILKPNSTYFGGAQVFQEFRGKGAYKALVEKRLEKLRKLNVELAVTQAREATSAPILRKVGFKTEFTDDIFQFDLE